MDGVVAEAEIVFQSADQVVVLSGADGVIGRGDVVVTTASNYTTVSVDAFSIIPSSGTFIADFNDGTSSQWNSTGNVAWRYLLASGSNDGPDTGFGGVGKFAQAEASSFGTATAELTYYFNQNRTECVDTVHNFAVYYHMWGTYGNLCKGALDVYYQTTTNSSWIHMVSATTIQTSRYDPWFLLEYQFNDSVVSNSVSAIKIVALPYHGQDACMWWSSVNIDNVTINSTSTCSLSGCSNSWPTASPVFTPSMSPVAQPTMLPTTQESVGVLNMDATFGILNCSASTLNENEQSVIVKSVAESMDINPYYVSYTSTNMVTNYSVNVRRRLVATTYYNLEVVVDINVPMYEYLSEFGTDSTAVAASLRSILNDSVVSGNFTAILQGKAAAASATGLMASSVSTVMLSSGQVVYAPTAAPTATPADSSTTTTISTFGIVGCVIGTIAVIALAYIFMKSKNLYKLSPDGAVPAVPTTNVEVVAVSGVTADI